MSTVGQREVLTQRRVVAFFEDALGYAYLGHWKDRQDNSNVEEGLAAGWLTREGAQRQDHRQGLARAGQGVGAGRQDGLAR